jgi:outer membrane protein W
MKKLHVFAMLIILAMACAAPVQAGQWYVGGGINTVNINEDIDIAGLDFKSGQGLTLNFGYYFQPAFSLDFVLGFSDHKDQDGDTVSYSRFDMGAQFAFGSADGFSPYLGVGIGSHQIDYDDYVDSFTGTSFFLSGGFDYYITPGHSVDFGVRIHAWDADLEIGPVTYHNIGDATTTVLSVMYNYHFLM